jgi:hypothetical protein
MDSNIARIGRLYHPYWANRNLDRSFLTPDERDLLERSDRLLDDVLNRLGFETEHEVFVEQTLTMKDGEFFGTPDRVYVWRERKSALVSDLKTGYIVVEPAELNLQLRGYAVLVAEAYAPLEHVYVAMLQPRLWSPSERITMAHYESGDLLLARKHIFSIMAAAEREDAVLHAGEEQCRYCKAKLTCPAFRDALTLPIVAFKSDDELSKAKREAVIKQRLAQCSDEQLEKVINACKFAEFVAEPAHDEARCRIEFGRFTKYMLGKPYEVRTITDARSAIAMLALSGVASREEILDICTIPLKQLEDAYRKRRGATWQQAHDKINRVLDSVIAREPRKAKIIPK